MTTSLQLGLNMRDQTARKHAADIERLVPLARELADSVEAGDVVLTLGAGDITRVGRELLERLTGADA